MGQRGRAPLSQQLDGAVGCMTPPGFGREMAQEGLNSRPGPQPWLRWAFLAVAIAFAFCGLILVPVWLQPSLSNKDLTAIKDAEKRVALQQAQAQLQNNMRVTLLQGFAGILLLAGAIATWRQVQISRDGQITERFTRAIDQLGNDNVDIRIGGIYTLERIARTSETDRTPIGEILAAFVRSHAPWPAGDPNHPDPHPPPVVDQALPWLRDRAPDVQAAMVVLGRRARGDREGTLVLIRVNLPRSYLSRGTLTEVDLGDSNLAGCHARYVRWERCAFSNTDLRKAILAGAVLDGSDFTHAHLDEVNLEGGSLRRANLSQSSLRSANLQNVDFSEANLSYADLRHADLTGARLTGARLHAVRSDDSTIWPSSSSL
jgi:Pentapeptide repeats (8 copies)